MCVACAAGETRAAGDDPLVDGDTTCTSRYCGENEYVSSGACVACAAGYANVRGDSVAGGDTTCDPIPVEVFTSLEDLKAAVAVCADPCHEASAWDVS